MRETLPIIEMPPSASAGRTDYARLAEDFGRAAREVGFFYLVGHAIDPALVESVFAQARAFFSLPAAEKERQSIRRSPHNRGYVAMEGESLDPGKAADLKEAFNIGLDLRPDDPRVLAGEPFRGVNLWPAIAGWRETMLAYFDAVWSLGRTLHRGIALDLGLDETCFEDKLDQPMATLRMLHYPPQPGRAAVGQIGAGEHTDYGNLTLLLTDEVGGLEVRKRNGEWIAAPPVAGAFVCNIGDCLMRWTNDVYVSTPHRVVNRGGRERYSVAFFLDPNPDALIDCLPTCVSPSKPARYRPVLGADYLVERLGRTYDFLAAPKAPA